MSEEELRLVTGTIFNIQHYCIHDGPGIRTNVFVKGCPLRCLWCANPESQSSAPQIMYRRDKCTGCFNCVSACPTQAISTTEDGKVVTDRTKCTGCGACVNSCPSEARVLSGKQVSAGEVFDEVAEDELFYGDDGGITVTGGEPLAQPKFTTALLELCRNAGIPTAIETSGFCSWDTAKSVFSLCDTVLYDCKQMNSELHQRYTGQGNERILENLRKINQELSCDIVVRVPVIPCYNAEEENIWNIAAFVSEEISRCRQIDLLAYHNLGESKSEQLEKDSEGFFSSVPSEEYMENLRNIVRSYGLLCK
ncbi:MAG: glycyl-radical enzyme activating protein [Lachnospiraceae bacterium]|nr:glycyl-radical enzyme activating protein [Lachnospiraceae bacterium]